MTLLKVSAACFILSVVCAVLGFGPSWADLVAFVMNSELYRIGFVIFVTLFLVTLVAGLLEGI